MSAVPDGLLEIGHIRRAHGLRGQVNVDLASGSLRVTSDEPVAEATIRDAVEEAGYQLASSPA